MLGIATSLRTLRNIRKATSTSIQRKYNIEDSKELSLITDEFLKIHGQHKSNFDFINGISKMLTNNINDVSIDDNSNKSEKTVEGMMQEIFASGKKAIGFDYLYRTIKQNFGKEEAKRIMGEIYDLSLGLSDSTNVLKPYSYYGNTTITCRLNGCIFYTTLKSLFEKFEEFSKYDEEHNMFEIKTTGVYKSHKMYNPYIMGKTVSSFNLDVLDSGSLKIHPKEYYNIEVWDGKNNWVNISRIIKHKNDKDFIIYQTKNGDFAFVTEDHPVFMDDGSEKLAGELSLGDTVLYDSNVYKNMAGKNISVPKDLAYFYGFILGDGNINGYELDKDFFTTSLDNTYKKFNRGGNNISIYQKDIDSSHILNIAKKVFHENTNFWKFNSSSNMCVNFSSAEFNYMCSIYFGNEYKENSFTKHLPENIMCWDKDSVLALIGGLIDSDGMVFKGDGRVSISLKSYAIINGLYDVLMSFDDLGFNGIYKRLSFSSKEKSFKSMMFSIAFKPSNVLKDFSQKLKEIDYDYSSYRQDCNNHSHENGNMVSKIYRYNFEEYDSGFGFLEKEVEYVYDITTDTGRFMSNGMVQHNCWALDSSRIVLEGRPFGQLKSKPPKKVASYISALCETIHQMSSHLAGALAIGNFFQDIAHISLFRQNMDLTMIRENPAVRKYLEDELQQFVHSVNHLSRTGSESPFTNISIFDRTKLKNMIMGKEDDENDNGMQWYFPFDKVREKEDFTGKEIDYVVDVIMEIQNIFIEFFEKGDPCDQGMPYRFPVSTLNFSIAQKDGFWHIVEKDFLKKMCQGQIYRHNIFMSEGTKTASCCRLISDLELMEEFASQSNSFGAGGSSNIGSHRVCTINFMRIGLECNSLQGFYDILEERLVSVAKVLRSHKDLIKEMTAQGLQSFISNGWINMDRMFSTFGIMGIYECIEHMKTKFDVPEDMQVQILTLVNKRVRELSIEYKLAGNIEQIPGESFAVRFAQADKLLFGDKVQYELYSNQYIPIWEDRPLAERLKADGALNKLVSGGGIVQIPLGEIPTPRQTMGIIEMAVKYGCEHISLSPIFARCKNGHITLTEKDDCPVCNDIIISRTSRIVGYFTDTSSWNKQRKEIDLPARKRANLEGL